MMLSIDLSGQSAVVTGGGAGIGYAIAAALAEAGAAVTLADISPDGEAKARHLQEQGGTAQFVLGDAASEEDALRAAEAAVNAYGGIDILVNNAGIYPRGGLLDTTAEVWDRVMEINLRSMFLCCKAVIPHMQQRGRGAIVNLGSSHAAVGLPELLAYSVSKGGVATLTRNLAGAHARDRIRVNCVNPGWVLTEKEQAEREAAGQSADWVRERGRALPLGRLQTGRDAANAVLFLVSSFADQITGQILNVDGGKEVASVFDDSAGSDSKEET
ncbi:SDR family NAD(P)-dependent oxidoreductase [Cohnella fermenti]|nr:SDR family oxidoreductase [Cohnella fermenti]